MELIKDYKAVWTTWEIGIVLLFGYSILHQSWVDELHLQNNSVVKVDITDDYYLFTKKKSLKMFWFFTRCNGLIKAYDFLFTKEK